MKLKQIKQLRGELSESSLEQLESKLIELREEQFKLRLRHKTGQLENGQGVREVRRNIARVKQMIGVKKSVS